MRQNMAGYYPNFSQQGEQKFTSYSQIPFHSSDIPMYSNQGTSARFFTDVFSGTSLSSQSNVDIPSIGIRNEMTFLPPTDNTMAMQDGGERLSSPPGNSVGNSVAGDSQVIQRLQLGILNDEQNFQYHGLSLSLGSKIPSSVSIPTYQYQNPSPGFSSLLGTHLPVSGIGAMSSTGEENNHNEEGNSNCLPSGTFGTNNSNKTDALLNPHCYGITKNMHSGPYLYEQSPSTNNVLSSKYLKAAQQLLDEVVNVITVLKQQESKKDQNNLDGPKDENSNPESQSKVGHSGAGKSNDKSSCELSPTQQQDLESKKLKLLSMIDEVDRRYREYRHQMQIVVSSFERIAGFGSAKPYTTLPLQTISRHYRCLRDAISGQIKVIQRSLGEQEDSPGSEGGVIPRLRYVDHQLRQQRALQQLGMMRNSWRPQRGLPEHAVSVLRAWLFEHFLHPYPKDSEKIMLARQAGLTRHQVANWFINARVRLWKPMIEEMYKEEFGDSELLSKSSTEDAPKAPKDQSSTAEIEGKELQDSMTSATADFVHPEQLINSKSDKAPDVEMNETIRETNFHNYSEVNGEGVYRMSKSQSEQRSKTDVQSIYLYDNILPNQIGTSGSMEGSVAYNISGSGNFAFGNQVSLDLGLQHSERDGFSISGGTHFRGNDIAVSSVGADALDYQCLDLGEQQQNYSNRQMLHDFVV